MDVQKEQLSELTKEVCKTLNIINEALKDEDKGKREKKCGRALKEIELVNDEAMRVGLGLSVRQIAQLKTRSRGSSNKHKTTEPREKTPFQVLMDHHAKNVVGPIPDGGAQGSAIKWLLQSFTPELAIKKYDELLREPWRHGRVSWLTVRQEIGRIQTNGTRQTDSTERNADRLNGNLSLIQELRGDSGGDNNEVECRPTAVNSR